MLKSSALMIPSLLGCLALLGLLLATAGNAAVLDVPADAERLPLGATLEYFLDEGGQLAPEAAMRDSRYHPAGGDSLTLGFRTAVLWARLTLRNPGHAAIERWLHIEPERLERVGLFLPESGGGYRRMENGLQVPVARRPVPARCIAFPLRLEAGATLTLYLRAQSRTRLSLLPMLWTPDAFERAAQREDLLAMLSIGALLGLSLYAITLFPLRRDWAALWLGLAMFCVCLFEAAYNGYDHAYWWPDRPEWSLRAAPVFGLLAQIGFNRFIVTLIPVRVFGWRWAGRWLDGLALAASALALALLFGAQFQRLLPVFPFLSLASQLSFLGLGLAALNKGYRPAGFLITGLLAVVSIVIVPRLGESQGWLAFSSLSAQAVMAAVMFAGSLLFFASMGGELRVDSRLGEGSRFWFEIGLDLASEEEIPMSFPDIDILGYLGPPRAILVVEDQAANRRLLEQLLAELGFVVHPAGGVGEGLELLASASFDLALLDQRLPDGTAWDILRALRVGGHAASVPAVLLSAQPPHPPEDWGELPGFDTVLLKPVGGAEVLECIGRLLGLAWQRADDAEALAGADATGRTAMPQGFLSAAERAKLAEWARQGSVYEIEEWVAQNCQTRPECSEFCREIEDCLATLSFEKMASFKAIQPSTI